MGYHASWLRAAFPRLLDEAVVAGRLGGAAKDDDDAADSHHLAVAAVVSRALPRPSTMTKLFDARPCTSCSCHVPSSVIHFWRRVIQPTMLLGGDTCAVHFWRRIIQPATLLDGDIGQGDHSETAVLSMFGMASPLLNGTVGKRLYSGNNTEDEEWRRFIRERRHWDPTWVRIVDSNLRGMGLTPFGPLSRLFLSMVALGTMLQSLKEVVSSITWVGENAMVLERLLLRLLIRALDQLPKSLDGAHAISFFEHMILDGSGCPFF